MTWREWLFIAVMVVLLILAFFFGKGCGGGTIQVETVYDTAVVTRYEDRVKTDTVVKWYEVTKTIGNPEKIYIQNVDTVFITKTADFDVMLSVKKEKDELIITALNRSGKVLKELRYKNIGRDFTATSVENNVIVKKENFYLNGITLFGDAMFPAKTKLQIKDADYNIGLKGGVTWLDRVDLNLKTNYSFSKQDFTFGVETEIKLW